MLLKSVFFTIAAALFFTSCNRELSFENGAIPAGSDSSGGTAVYTFVGGSGSCTDAVISGAYTAGVVLTSSNMIVLQVNVSTIGTYILSTNTVNGISFNGSGSFTTTGVQTITLAGAGTPATPGIFNFSVGSNGCLVGVTIAAAGNTAAGTFDCAGITFSGIYTKGVVLNSSNTISIPVNVTTAGSYSISTSVINGCTFSGSGVLAAGIQIIVLTGTGAPTASGSNTYNFVLGTSNCSFLINFLVAGSTSGIFLKCKIDGILFNYNTNLKGYNLTPPNAGIPYSLSAQGKNSDVSNSIEEFWVTVQNPTAITTGIYNNGTISSGITDRLSQVSLFPTGFPNLYWGSSALNANTISVNITSITAHIATGTFSGTLYESNGLGPQIKQITEGQFQISF